MDALEKETSFIPAGIRTPDRPVRSLATILTELSCKGRLTYSFRSHSLFYLLTSVEVVYFHLHLHTTVGRTPLEEGWARRRDLYLTTQTLYNRQTSMSPVGFEPTIPARARPQTYPLNRAAARIDRFTYPNINVPCRTLQALLFAGLVYRKAPVCSNAPYTVLYRKVPVCSNAPYTVLYHLWLQSLANSSCYSEWAS
jgi:hypothetical protein